MFRGTEAVLEAPDGPTPYWDTISVFPQISLPPVIPIDHPCRAYQASHSGGGGTSIVILFDFIYDQYPHTQHTSRLHQFEAPAFMIRPPHAETRKRRDTRGKNHNRKDVSGEFLV